MTETTAWYLRCGPDDVGDRAVLVGDRGRVALAATCLDDVHWVNEDRGLTTATGHYNGRRITVSAFGMGAPIAAVVLDELAQLGVHTVVRLGTTMAVDPARLGDLVIAEAAVREESTADTYVPRGYPAAADPSFTLALLQAAAPTGRPTRVGLIASYDGFYPQMLPAGGAARQPPGVLGLDMETSAVLAVGRSLGVVVGSACLATVAASDGSRLPDDLRQVGERDLIQIGLDALTAADQPPSQED